MIAKLLQIYILQGDQNWQRETSFDCQSWSSQTDFGSKSGPGDQFWQKILFYQNWSSQNDFKGDQFWHDNTIIKLTVTSFLFIFEEILGLF